MSQKDNSVGLLGQALRALGTAGGAAVGGYLGNPVTGGAVGNSLGATISRWLGAGDYTVGSNTLVQRVSNGSPAIPAMHNAGQSVVIRHKEYLGEITSAQAFTVRHQYDLNPGLSYTFPWLATIASQFQEYRVKGMVFHYVPTSGIFNSSSAALGSVMIQTSYRATEAAPASKVEMLNEYWATESSPAEGFCHPIECDPKENPFNVQYVRTGALPSAENQLMYDLGRTFVAVSGMSNSTTVLGDLWVTYEVELKKPIVASSVSNVLNVCTVSSLAGFNPTPGTWFASTGTVAGTFRVTMGSQTILFPKGKTGVFTIMVRIAATGNFTAMDLSGAPTLSNCIAANVYPDSTTPNTYYRTVATTATGLSSGYYQTNVYIVDPQAQASVTFPAGTWTGTATSFDIIITETL